MVETILIVVGLVIVYVVFKILVGIGEAWKR
jgi:hypothetical protein